MKGQLGNKWKFSNLNLSPLESVAGWSLPVVFNVNAYGEAFFFIQVTRILGSDNSRDRYVSAQLPLSGITRQFHRCGGSIGGTLSGYTGLFGVVSGEADQSQLPIEQSNLGTSYNNQPKREKTGRIMRNPIPKSAFWWLLAIFFCSIGGGLMLGWRAAR